MITYQQLPWSLPQLGYGHEKESYFYVGILVHGSKRWEQASCICPCRPAHLWRHSGASIAHAVAGEGYNWIMLDHFSYSRVASSMWHISSALSWVKRVSQSESVLTLSLTTSSRPFCLHTFLATSQLSHDNSSDNSCQYFGLTKWYEDRQAVPKCIRKQFRKVCFQKHKLWKMSIAQFLRDIRWTQVLGVWDLSQKSHLDRWSTWLSSHIKP